MGGERRGEGGAAQWRFPGGGAVAAAVSSAGLAVFFYLFIFIFNIGCKFFSNIFSLDLDAKVFLQIFFNYSQTFSYQSFSFSSSKYFS